MSYQKGKTNPPAQSNPGDGYSGNSRTTTIMEVLEFPILSIEDRGISQRTAEHFGVRTEMSEDDNTKAVAHYFPYTDDGEIVAFVRIRHCLRRIRGADRSGGRTDRRGDERRRTCGAPRRQ